MNQRQAIQYMRTAVLWSWMSRDKRRQVGCVLVKEDILVASYNGTPPGWDNTCQQDDVTLPEVIHAEENCLDKFLRAGISPVGATVFTTDAPCLKCAIRLANAQVAKVHYMREYRLQDGIEHLIARGISISKMEIISEYQDRG